MFASQLCFSSVAPVWLLSSVKLCLFHIMDPWGCFRLHTFPHNLLYPAGDCSLAMTAHCVSGWVVESVDIVVGKLSSLGQNRVLDVVSNSVLVKLCGIMIQHHGHDHRKRHWNYISVET